MSASEAVPFNNPQHTATDYDPPAVGVGVGPPSIGCGFGGPPLPAPPSFDPLSFPGGSFALPTKPPAPGPCTGIGAPIAPLTGDLAPSFCPLVPGCALVGLCFLNTFPMPCPCPLSSSVTDPLPSLPLSRISNRPDSSTVTGALSLLLCPDRPDRVDGSVRERVTPAGEGEPSARDDGVSATGERSLGSIGWSRFFDASLRGKT